MTDFTCHYCHITIHNIAPLLPEEPDVAIVGDATITFNYFMTKPVATAHAERVDGRHWQMTVEAQDKRTLAGVFRDALRRDSLTGADFVSLMTPEIIAALNAHERSPLNRGAGNEECRCGSAWDDVGDRDDDECPFTLVGTAILDDLPLCTACSYGPRHPMHGPAERCHGVKRNAWTLGESGCPDPAEHHMYVPFDDEGGGK